MSRVVAAVHDLTILPRAELSRWVHLNLRTVKHREIATVIGSAGEQPLEVFVADVHAAGLSGSLVG